MILMRRVARSIDLQYYLICNANILGQKVEAPSRFALSRMDKAGDPLKEGEEVLFECSLHALPLGLVQFKWLLQLAGESRLESFDAICAAFQLACRTVCFLLSQ